MQYWQQGQLIRRYKRFLADIITQEGELLTIHCPNTGSMRNCTAEGSPCWYSTSNSITRKYPHTWEVATTPTGALAGINTNRANTLVREAISNGVITELAGYPELRAEVKYGAENSRIDFLLSGKGSEWHGTSSPSSSPRRRGSKNTDALETLDSRLRGNDDNCGLNAKDVPFGPDCYVEVKSVTLMEEPGQGLFPDAVSSRGSRHLRELMAMKAAGKRAVLLFCVQHSQIEWVEPARAIDPVYAATLVEAANQGVEIIAYGATIEPEYSRIALTHPLPVRL